MPSRKAFTIIEVTLFLAVTGFLMASILAIMSVNISRQRYNDAVNSFVDFLRSIYAEVSNVENVRATDTPLNKNCTISAPTTSKIGQEDNLSPAPGRSECLIYGKLVTFGEGGDATTLHVYDVVGDSTYKIAADWYRKDDATQYYKVSTDLQALGSEAGETGTTINTAGVHADVLAIDRTTDRVTTAGQHYTYELQWGARVEDPNTEGYYERDDATVTAYDDPLFRGSLLVVRSPLSGSIHTFISGSIVEAYSAIGSTSAPASARLASFLPAANPAAFTNTMPVLFCVGSADSFASSGRRLVRIIADANSATAVELVSQDEGDAQCRR